MSKQIVHVGVLLVSIVLTFIIPQTVLANYDLQIAASLFIILFLTKKILAKDSPRSRLLESVVFTLIILLVVNTTGGVNSSFFFLLYFLLFALSLILEPAAALSSSLALVVLYLLTLPQGQDLKQLLPVLSLAFLTPFAIFMGKEYLEAQNSKIKAQSVKKDTFLFLSLTLKNHLKSIKSAVENFLGDHELHQIKKHTQAIERLIEEYEKIS